MKRLVLFLTLLLSVSLFAQQDSKIWYKFTDDIRLPATPVRNQWWTGTCWAWSTLSFFESEMMRINHITDTAQVPELSVMYVVNKCYKEKAKNYVLWHGKVNFDEGGEAHDVLCALKKYGIVPMSVYTGLNYGSKVFNHKELNEILKKYLKVLIDEDRLTTAWERGFNQVVDAYLGKTPQAFTYNGQTYTPQQFLKQVVKVNPDDYVPITSFSHHPFYKKFILEMPDNWAHKAFYNVPLDDMMRIIDYSLEHGYTVAWGADVSEPYFSINGIALVPKSAFDTIDGVITPKWTSRRYGKKYSFDKYYEQMPITQDLRQRAFEHYTTTDDHGMHIIGRAHDQKGEIFYIVKNSWGTNVGYDGYWYFSKNYVEYKTMSILVHKNAIPQDIRKKLGIK